jgi:acyl carrier protein
MKQNICQLVKNTLIEVLKLDKDTLISGKTKLKDNLGLDSMSSLTFLVTLEENIDGFIVDPDSLQISDLETLDSISQYVLKEISNASSIYLYQDNDLVKATYA